MTEEQWERLVATIGGEASSPPPVGFIIDSPWLPNWAGMSILDYFTSDERWLGANLQVVKQFPQIIFLPGFWSEFGMCTEPSAFGVKCIWHEDEFPFAEPVATSIAEAAALPKPDCRTCGLPPFVLKRLQHHEAQIRDAGHAIRFAIARGPLNVASFLMGSTEFMMALKLDPDKAHALLRTVTDFLVDWLQYQAGAFETVDGILILDDIVGFLGDDDCREFALPYLKECFEAVDATVRFFHNDAQGKVCAPHLPEIGVNLFNFAFEHSLAEMREWTGGQVALLGNIPPRDVLAAGTPEQVAQCVTDTLAPLDDTAGIILSCGGGMPPGVSTENIQAFLTAAGS